jgi:hypothetical protein
MKCLAILVVLISAASAIAQNPPAAGGDAWVYGSGANTWDTSWNSRPDPDKGACFYTTTPYAGNHFCVRKGDRLPEMPGNLEGNISSIKIFGGATVEIYNSPKFANGATIVRKSVADLRTFHFRNGHSWNDRIMSVAVK